MFTMGVVGLVILALSCWRLSSLIAREDGPLDIPAKIRVKLGVRYNERSEMYATGFWSEMVLCMWCNSVWIGAVLTVLYVLLADIALLLLLPLALSAATILVEKE